MATITEATSCDWTSSGSQDWGTTTKIATLKAASYFTDPICKVREYFYTFYILDKICQSTAQKVMQAALLTLGILVCSLLTPAALVGVLLRGAVATLESKPHIYLKRKGAVKQLPPDRSLTLFSHNVCYMPGGYSITDGQVTPPSDKQRMMANLQKIQTSQPDLVCLYEVPDILDAAFISSQLPDYPCIIPVAGVRAIGPSSMMYVASKYEIVKDSIEFTPFIKGEELTGRAQRSEKGVLSFDIQSQGTPFATVISTHLQHSEIPADPKRKKSDQIARAAQMRKIAQKIEAKMKTQAVIFTGDLNQEESELDAFFKKHNIDWLRRDSSIAGKPTWDGDKWCADLMGKTASGPLVLDYTWIAGKATSISTQILETGYVGTEFIAAATSDHKPLLSTITINDS